MIRSSEVIRKVLGKRLYGWSKNSNPDWREAQRTQEVRMLGRK